MPRAVVNGVELAWIERGEGPETVVFAHSYLVDHRQFEHQIDALAERYRVIAYDHRDHGASARVGAPYPFEAIVEDAVALIRHTDATPCHFVGLSTGGFVATRLLVHHPELLRSAVVMDASGREEPRRARLKYQGMFLVLRLLGIHPLLNTTMGLMFGASTLRDPAKRATLDLWRARIAANDPKALIRFGDAIFGRDDVMEGLGRVERPVMVMVGEEDRPQPVSASRALAARIPGARLEVVRAAGHLCTVEQPEAVTAALTSFLAST